MTPVTDNPQASTPKPVRVLVAEDSPLNRQIALKQLEKLGYAADGVGDGTEALEALKRTSYGIILMDCQMPEVDGFMATRELREAGDTTPVIALTAYALQGDRDKCIAAGMDGYLTKPIDFHELERTLSVYVDPGVDVRMSAEVPDHV